MKGKPKTELVLKVMHVVAWIVFVSFAAEAVGMLVLYTIKLFSPVASERLEIGEDLSRVQSYRVSHYIYVVSILVTMVAAKAYAAFMVIKILSKLNLRNPFDGEVAARIERVSYVVLGMGGMLLLSNAYFDWLMHRGVHVPLDENVGEFLFLAGIIFIIAQVFKKGVEMQAENELTI